MAKDITKVVQDKLDQVLVKLKSAERLARNVENNEAGVAGLEKLNAYLTAFMSDTKVHLFELAL